MPRILVLCFLLLFVSAGTFAQPQTNNKALTDICLTKTELELYRQINEYRHQKGLPEVKLSLSLCIVARTHAMDQTASHNFGDRCNLHSWSDKGSWSACCYTPDHKQAKSMWNKPRELTNYQGDGYEISYYSTYKYDSPAAFAKDILEGWKKSPGHNEVIMNKSIWKQVSWEAIGVGIYGEYADVWFGKEEDMTGAPKACE